MGGGTVTASVSNKTYYDTSLNISNYYAVGAKTNNGDMCYPYILSNGNWRIFFLQNDNGVIKLVSVTDTVTVYYKKI